MPGTQKKQLNTKLIRKSLPSPNFKKTAKGGNKIQIIILTNWLKTFSFPRKNNAQSF